MRAVGRWLKRAGRLAFSKGLSVDQLVDLADAARDQKDFAGAAALYGASLRVAPARAAIHIQSAHMNKETGQYEAAERNYLFALALTPEDPDLHLQLGHFYKVAKRLGEAVEAYRRAVELQPDNADASFELMTLTGAGAFMPAPETGRAAGARGRFAGEPWVERFNVLEFRTLSPDLGARATSRDAALELFVSEGIERLAPISAQLAFDPDFYRSLSPAIRTLSDQDTYRHWLFQGLERGLPGSESQALTALHCTGYPTAFDWESYARHLPPEKDSQSHTRLSALAHLFETGFREGRRVPASGPDQALLYRYLADHQLARGHLEAAARALTEVLAAAPQNGKAAFQLADIYHDMGELDDAYRYYHQAYAAGFTHLWTYIRLNHEAIASNDFDAAYRLLAESKGPYSGEVPWAQALVDTSEAHFQAAWSAGLAAYRVSDKDKGDACISQAIERLIAAFRDLDDLPARLPPCPEGHVVMLSLLSVPQCRHYRVEQRLQQFAHLGISVRPFGATRHVEAREALVGARALIIYREPAMSGTIRLVLHAQALGVPVYFEIDDLIFDGDHYPPPFVEEAVQYTFDDHIGLIAGIRSYRSMLQLSDRAIASTGRLADHMRPLTRERRALVISNGLDSRNNPFLVEPVAQLRSDDVFVFYGSGTQTHNINFNTEVAPALTVVMKRRPQVRLVVVGYLDIDDELLNYSDRITFVPFVNSIQAYWALLSEMDINIAALTHSEFNDCKSEIKWLEAAACGLPSIVSASATFKAVINDGVDGLLADSQAGWEEALLQLIDDPGRRRAMGEQARRQVLLRYSLATISEQLKLEFAPQPGFSTAPLPSRRIRVLIVHILFPPQAFGGATRVVVDNVDDLLHRHGDAVDLAVFTSDLSSANPRSRVGRYGDVPVFRFGFKMQKDSEPEDSSIVPFFNQALDAFRPDVVHFHCIQLLTATVVEITRQRDIPYIVTLHDGWWLSSNQFFLDKDFFPKQTPVRVIEEIDESLDLPEEVRRRHFLVDLLARAALVTAVSDGFAAFYRQRTGLSIRPVPNGISAVFRDRKRPPRTLAGRVRLGHLGGWAPHKGIHLLHAALSGGGFRNLEATVVDHRRSGNASDEQLWGTTCVHVIGKVPQSEMAHFYDSIDVLVAPSICPESFGLITREAMVCGVWVVTSRMGGIGDDVVEGDNGFLIDVDGPDGLTAALRTIDGDPARYRSAPEVVRPVRFAFQQADELASIYKEIAKADRLYEHRLQNRPLQPMPLD